MLESEEGEKARKRMVEMARAFGAKIRPMETQYCEFHRNNHLIELADDEVIDSRYGRAPVDVPVSDKPETYKSKTYCRVCCAYHAGDGNCGGERKAENWADREWLG